VLRFLRTVRRVSAANPGRQPHAWGEAATAHLRQRWTDGAGTALIGTELGVSKSAVVGKAHRLGLAPRPSPIRAAGQTRPPARPRPVKPPRPPRPPKAVQAPPEPRPVLPPPSPPPEPVAPRGCQYPRGNRPHWDWCDAPVTGHGPYCAAHRAIAYLRPGTRAWMQERAEAAA
jgi:GcrA cell cycle regulator